MIREIEDIQRELRRVSQRPDTDEVLPILMLSDSVDKERSVEDLEGSLRSVHELRKHPIKNLSVEDLRRLIGQDVGLRWLLPVALDFLRETAPDEAVTGWYDDDLLSAVLTRKNSTTRP
ncbi:MULTISPECIES: contact-dependent growth inhibition system immunity protein [Streptomyces]|uniref:Contact-dependent growth inhibition system immunity protein n=2 Tax=Streptomyces TaxID=1883 RepID=A0ABV9IHD6_9ACTN